MKEFLGSDFDKNFSDKCQVIILIVDLYEVYDYACLCLNNMLCYPFKKDSLLFLLHD